MTKQESGWAEVIVIGAGEVCLIGLFFALLFIIRLEMTCCQPEGRLWLLVEVLSRKQKLIA